MTCKGNGNGVEIVYYLNFFEFGVPFRLRLSNLEILNLENF